MNRRSILTGALAALVCATAAFHGTAHAALNTNTQGSAAMNQQGAAASPEIDDERFVNQFGDTSVPEGRVEAFFHDELAGQTAPEETTAARTRRLEAQAAAADAVSTATNVKWRKENLMVDPVAIELSNVKVKLGNEVLFEDAQYQGLLKGKRVGLITNPTGMDSRFVSTIDKLFRMQDVKLTALFAPEHGVRGEKGAGDKVQNEIDPVTGVQIYSLHGEDAKKRRQNKPRPSMLRDVDVLVYDIQDIGNRSYTYVGTMKLCMQAAKENGKEFVVLDRPNPMGGNLVSGPMLDPRYVTLVGWGPVAYIYGLTPGETARLLNEEIGCKLTVVPMKGWKRDMVWEDTGLPWIPTSTHMQHADDCWFIAITGMLGELTFVSVGVGYPGPFRYVGAPWIDGVRLAHEMNNRRLPGLYFRPAYYEPYYNSYKGRQCSGVHIIITDRDKVKPVEAGIHLVEAINTLYPEQKLMLAGPDADLGKSKARVSMFNKVMGSGKVRKALLDGRKADEIIAEWKTELDKFTQDRRKFFLYE